MRGAEKRGGAAGALALMTGFTAGAGGAIRFVRLAFIDVTPTQFLLRLLETHGFVRGGSWHNAHCPPGADGVPGDATVTGLETASRACRKKAQKAQETPSSRGAAKGREPHKKVCLRWDDAA